MAASQPEIEVKCELVNDVLERLQCHVCKKAMVDPVQLRVRVRSMLTMTGCRACLAPLKDECDAIWSRRRPQLIDLFSIREELDMTAAICTNCNTKMLQFECAAHVKICKLRKTLTDCDICHEFYPTTGLDAHEKSERHIMAALQKELAEVKSLKHAREDDELPAAKRQKKGNDAPIEIPDPGDDDEKKHDSEPVIILDNVVPPPQI
jgi:RNase P subunit RPR2